MKTEPDIYRGTAIVAFIDILGFSDSISKYWSIEQNNPLERLLEIRKTAEKVSEEPLAGFAIEGKEDEPYISGTIKVISLSDSFILLHSIEQKEDSSINNTEFLTGLFCVLEGIKTIWTKSIELGYTIRGSIVYQHIYWDDKSNIVGPALIEAYRLESQLAKTSRVIISTKLNEMLAEFLAFHRIPPLEAAILEKFTKDIDGFIIVDPKYALAEISELSRTLMTLCNNIESPIVQEKVVALLASLESNYEIKRTDFGRF